MISREAGRQFDLNSPLTNSDQDSVSSASSSDPDTSRESGRETPSALSAPLR